MAVKPQARMSRAELLAALRSAEQREQVRDEDLWVCQEEIRIQQAQLIDSHRQLEVSRDRYADLYDFAPVGYLTLDAHGVVQEINLTGARLLGVDRGRLVGTPFLVYVAESDRRAFLDHMGRCRRAGLIGEVMTELSVLPRGGPPTPVALETRGSSGPGGTSFRTVILDVSERRRAEDARLRAERERQQRAREEDAARAASETKDRFLAMLSHELRAPLTSLVFTLGAIRERGELPPSLLPAFGVIDRNIDLEVRLIDDLLDVTRIQRGKLRLERAPVDAHHLVHDLVETFTGEASARGIALSVEAAAAEPRVHVDPARLRQVLRNLITNALNHTPQGGRITVGVATPGDGLLSLQVRDTGVGIAPEALDHLFEPFHQARDGQGTRGGLGLGLAIAKGIVEAHGGKIVAESEGSNTGAAFTVTLHTAVGEPAAPPGPRAVHPPQPGRHVLIVEDNEDNARAIAEFLRLRGYRVSVASSIAAGVEAAREGFDVLVSDIGLPDGSGLELVQRLSREEPVRSIALSGYGTRQDIQRSRDAGFQAHLTKPVDPEELVDAIERVASEATPPLAGNAG